MIIGHDKLCTICPNSSGCDKDIAGSRMVNFERYIGPLHGGAEVVPDIIISIGVRIIMRDQAQVEITIAPTVSIRTKYKVFCIALTITVSYFVGDCKIPVVPVVDAGTMVHKL